MVMTNLEKEIYRLVDGIDFDNVYENVSSFVLDDIASMLRNKDSGKANQTIAELKIDASKLTSDDICDYIYPNENGSIMINGENYSMEKFVFKLIHNYVYELVNQEIEQGFRCVKRSETYANLSNSSRLWINNLYKQLFHNKLHAVLKNQPIAKKYFSDTKLNMGRPNYKSKQEYIESCIHSSILVNYLTYCKGVNLASELKA